MQAGWGTLPPQQMQQLLQSQLLLTQQQMQAVQVLGCSARRLAQLPAPYRYTRQEYLHSCSSVQPASPHTAGERSARGAPPLLLQASGVRPAALPIAGFPAAGAAASPAAAGSPDASGAPKLAPQPPAASLPLAPPLTGVAEAAGAGEDEEGAELQYPAPEAAHEEVGAVLCCAACAVRAAHGPALWAGAAAWRGGGEEARPALPDGWGSQGGRRAQPAAAQPLQPASAARHSCMAEPASGGAKHGAARFCPLHRV